MNKTMKTILAGSAIVGAVVGASMTYYFRDTRPVVPLVRLSGTIGGAGSLLSPAGLEFFEINEELEKAFKTRRAKAVALSINSPGGSPVQSSLITNRVRQLAEKHHLPVIAFIEDYGASGGYFLALGGDEIYADESSVIGSVGVIYAGLGFDKAIAKLGIERRVVTAGNSKSQLDPFLPTDQRNVSSLKALLDEVHTSFKATVRDRRAGKLIGSDAELFEGQVWTGKSAEKLGLIDGIGTPHSVLSEKFGDDVKIVPITKPKAWWRKVIGIAAHELVQATIAAAGGQIKTGP